MRATEALEYYNQAGRDNKRNVAKRFMHFSPTLYPTKAPEEPKPAAPAHKAITQPAKSNQFNAAIPPLEVFKTIFGRCRGDSVIATGWIDPDKPGTDNRRPSPLCPVPVAAMDRWFPEIFNWQVTQTQYMIPNTLNPKAVKGRDRGPIAEHARIQWFHTRGRDVRELCAMVLDLDVWREDVSAPWRDNPQEALLDAMRLWFNDELPAPSMATLSGRGAYLIWLLRDEGSTAPPEATRDNIAAWNLIAAELARRTRHLGADGTFPSHWYKRPGTIDLRTGNEVKYMLFGSTSVGAVPLHSLSDMQSALGVYHHQIDMRKQPSFRPPERVRKRQVKRGQGAQSWRRRVEEIERLNQHRGGFRESTPSREKALWLYYHCLRAQLRAEYPQEKRQDAATAAYHRAVAFSSTFRPPLSEAEISAAVDYSTTKCRFRRDRLAAILGVTEQEAIDLDLQAIVPYRLDVAKRAEQARQEADRKQAKADRDATIERLLSEGKSDAHIARQVGAHRSTIGRRRKETQPHPTVPQLPY